MKQRSQSVIRGTRSRRSSIFGIAIGLFLLVFSTLLGLSALLGFSATALAQDAVEEERSEKEVIEETSAKQLDKVSKEPEAPSPAASSPAAPLPAGSEREAARISRRAAREAADAPFIGKPVAQIDLVCDLELCRNPVAVDRFKELSGLYVGQNFSSQAQQRAQERLAKTGFFQTLEFNKELSNDRVIITITARGAVLIRKVSFEGLSPPPFETDLRKLLIYRPGQAYTKDDNKADAQLVSLQEVFAREGFFGSKIVMTVEKVGDQEHLVDMTFKVDKGGELAICDIGLRGVRAMRYSRARELLLTSLPFFARRVPLITPTFTTQDYRAGREALIQHYRRNGYFRARIIDQAAKTDIEKGCVELLLEINEGPHWQVNFQGNKLFKKAELVALLPFIETGYVDSEAISQAEHEIRKLYETRGYPFTAVTGKEVLVDRDTRSIEFEIVEGPQLQIQDIILHGNEQIASSTLLKSFGTQRYALLSPGGYLQTDQLLDDFSKIEAAYRQLGYLQAMVVRFSLEALPSDKAMIVHIFIEEGFRTVAERVDLSGARVVPAGTLLSLLNVSNGNAFVPLSVRADQARLLQHYASIGYPMTQIKTTCRLLNGEEVTCDAPMLPRGCKATNLVELKPLCGTNNEEHRLSCELIRPEEECKFEGGAIEPDVRVRHVIEEGPRVRVGEILLKGNFRTDANLIYQELPLKTGDRFNVNKVLEGQGNMRSLGLFDSVSIETIGLEDNLDDDGSDTLNVDDERTAALVISVEESRSRYLDFKFGLEGRDLLGDSRRLLVTGEVQYNDSNLFGYGQRFRPRVIAAVDAFDLWEVGADTTQDIGAAQNITGLDYLVGAELIYTHPRFLKQWTKVDKLYLTITPFYLLDLLGVANDEVLREEWGLRLELRKELFELMDRLTLTFGIEAKQAATWTPNDPMFGKWRLFSPRRSTGKLSPEITLDRRDSPLNPHEGYHLQVKPQLVSGDALTQGAEDAIGDSYLRLNFAASVYFSLWEDLVFGQSFRFGQIIPLAGRQTIVPPDERFFLGGVGSVRGFPTNSLGPIIGFQRAPGGELMLNYNAEIRFPIVKQWNVYGATFFDAGLLTDCFSQANNRSSANCYRNAFPEDAPFGNIRTTVGLGLRYLILDQIPVLFDYGIVLDRRAGEDFGSFHFNLGYTF